MAKKVEKVDTRKEELEMAVKLLRAAVGFINEAPNRRVRNNQFYDTSYSIASDIDRFISKYQNGDSIKGA